MAAPLSQHIGLESAKKTGTSGEHQIPVFLPTSALQMIERSLYLVDEPRPVNFFVGVGDNEGVPVG